MDEAVNLGYILDNVFQASKSILVDKGSPPTLSPESQISRTSLVKISGDQRGDLEDMPNSSGLTFGPLSIAFSTPISSFGMLRPNFGITLQLFSSACKSAWRQLAEYLQYYEIPGAGAW